MGTKAESMGVSIAVALEFLRGHIFSEGQSGGILTGKSDAKEQWNSSIQASLITLQCSQYATPYDW